MLRLLASMALVSVAVLTACSTNESASTPPASSGPILVTMSTSAGDILLELDPDRAPASVANFLAHTDRGDYDGTIFHRVIPTFVIQGGGFTPDLNERAKTDEVAGRKDTPIKNEWTNGLKNTRGTIAMARDAEPDTATREFYINLADNPKLDGPRPQTGNAGYAVFGRVVQGMDVVDRIKTGPTHDRPDVIVDGEGMKNVPVEAIVIRGVAVMSRDAATRTRLNAVVDRFCAAGYSGSVSVFGRDGLLVDRSCGHADRSKSKAFVPTTASNVASISKAFTSVAVLRLVEAGKLRLTDKLSERLPGVPADRAGVTIEQLLTHMSGFGQNYSADGIADRDEAVRAILASPMAAKPGEKMIYSNDNFQLLAAIIELASGETFDRYMTHSVLEPAAMRDSFVWADLARHPPPASAEPRQDIGPALASPNWGCRGSTGMCISARDLCRFWRAVERDQLLSAASRRAMLSAHSEFNKEWAYGFGWLVGTTPAGGRRIGARGTEDCGYNAMLLARPDDGLLIGTVANCGEMDGVQAARKLAAELEAAFVALEHP